MATEVSTALAEPPLAETPDPPITTQATSTERDWLWHPAAIVFISNACIMIIELVAGRLVAPFIGVSLYTWTTIIGVILAGISLGNFIGGKMADRFASRRLLGGLFIAAGLATLSVLVTVTLFGEAGLPRMPGVPLVVRMVAYISAIYFLPSVIIGLISPVVIKLSLNDLSKTGNVVGRIYASSALGSIVGTFLTGFFLISWFGTRAIMLGTGILLVVMGLVLGRFFRRTGVAMVAGWVFVMVMLAARPAYANYLQNVCTRETNYFCIRVREETRDDEKVQILTLDRLVHSYTSLDNPKKLVYAYEKVGAEVLDYLRERDRGLDVFFIGGGGYTLPKYIEALEPRAHIEVAEIDPGVTDIAYDRLGLPRDTAIKSFNQDARLLLTDLDAQKKYNFVLGDAFNDFSVPYHLTTKEFNDLVRAHMTDDGIYMLNLIDGADLPFVGAFMRTLQQSFAHVYLVSSTPISSRPARNTFVLLASNQPIDVNKLQGYTGEDSAHEIASWLASDDDARQVRQNGSFVLTDEYVPTDQLLTPMFEASEAVR